MHPIVQDIIFLNFRMIDTWRISNCMSIRSKRKGRNECDFVVVEEISIFLYTHSDKMRKKNSDSVCCIDLCMVFTCRCSPLTHAFRRVSSKQNEQPYHQSPLHAIYLCIIIVVVQSMSLNAVIYDILCGDDFKAELANVEPGDITQIAASCTSDSCCFENGEKYVYDLERDIPNANFADEDAGFIIRDASSQAQTDTIVNARIADCEAHILFENISFAP